VTDEAPTGADAKPASGLGRHAPLLIAAALFAVCLGRAVLSAMAKTDGTIRYGCDDAYIHLAYAKQFAATGVWGVSGGEFVHASSSPLWVVLLAGLFKLTGPFTAAPFLVNAAASLGVLWVLHAAMLRRGVGATVRAVALSALVLVVPLSWLTMTGMEHVLQLLADLVFCLLVVGMLGDDAPRARRTALACVVAAVVVATRLEGAFLVGGASGLFALRRRWGEAVLLSACGAAPIVAVGLVAMSHGWTFLPSSIALKGEMPSFATKWGAVSALGGHGLAAWSSSTELVCITLLTIAAAACVAASPRGALPRLTPLLVLVVCATAAQCQFAWIRGRYTAYLAGLGISGLALAAPAIPPALVRSLAAKCAWAAALAPLLWHGLVREAGAPTAVKNIHEQQGQLARFLADRPGGGAVALNDIGAVSYFTGARVVDVWGLATREVAMARVRREYTTERMDEICRAHDVRIAAVYDAWFNGSECPPPPASWTRVGTWRIPDNVVCGSDLVTFYAVAPGEAAPLRARLAEFAPRLPAGVTHTLD
jgi:hypothetical protein